ncbi:MAG TPA: acyltransferase [Candidatus Dormibacteraeota bacterium]|nr:acyltransferase [Candidatus Dormibacteraeota bacterium]
MTQTVAAPSPGLPRGETLPARGGRLPFIDRLRGLAMLMVMAYHCWVHTIRSPIAVPVGRWRVDVTSPLHLGYLGVHLFLVLSGFCLTYPLARDGAAAMRLDPHRFFRRRAWRILPPYYAALAVFALFPLLERAVRVSLGRPVAGVPSVTVGQVLSHLLMVHNFSLAWMGSINASFWSLALEWQLYLAFPLLVWGFCRWGPARTLAAVLALTLAYRTWVYRTQDVNRLEIGYLYSYALPGRLFEFVLGMTAALALARLPVTPGPGWIRRYLAGAVALGLMGVLVAHRWSLFSPVTDVVWGLSFFCLVMYAGGRSAAGGGWLDSRPLVALGLISYSVYLIHEPLIRSGYGVIESLHLAPVATLLLFELGIAPLLIALGWLFFCAVEARFVRKR